MPAQTAIDGSKNSLDLDFGFRGIDRIAGAGAGRSGHSGFNPDGRRNEMRLQPGQKAIPFEMEDVFDNRISLEDYRGKRLLLSFYRYAGCPLCNYRIEKLVLLTPRFRRLGLDMLAVFQSPKESILYYVEKRDSPFSIIADPERRIYRAYGVEPSWKGLFKGAVRLPTLLRASRRGFFPGKVEGNPAMLPADFLIDETLVVREAYYGKDVETILPRTRSSGGCGNGGGGEGIPGFGCRFGASCRLPGC